MVPESGGAGGGIGGSGLGFLDSAGGGPPKNDLPDFPSVTSFGSEAFSLSTPSNSSLK